MAVSGLANLLTMLLSPAFMLRGLFKFLQLEEKKKKSHNVLAKFLVFFLLGRTCSRLLLHVWSKDRCQTSSTSASLTEGAINQNLKVNVVFELCGMKSNHLKRTKRKRRRRSKPAPHGAQGDRGIIEKLQLLQHPI